MSAPWTGSTTASSFTGTGRRGPFGRRGAGATQGFSRSRRQSRRSRTVFDARSRPWWSDACAWLARYLRKLVGDEQGVAAVEFGLIVAALAPVFIYGGTVLGPALDHWATSLTAAVQHGEQVLSKLEACR